MRTLLVLIIILILSGCVCGAEGPFCTHDMQIIGGLGFFTAQFYIFRHWILKKIDSVKCACNRHINHNNK